MAERIVSPGVFTRERDLSFSTSKEWRNRCNCRSTVKGRFVPTPNFLFL